MLRYVTPEQIVITYLLDDVGYNFQS